MLIFGIVLRYFFVIEKMEIFWFFIYCFTQFIVLFLYGIVFYEKILNYFLNPIVEPIVVLDSTQFTLNIIDFIFNCVYLFIIIPSLFVFFVLNKNIINTFLRIYLFIALFIVVYFLVLVFWIIKSDIFFSNWFSFSFMPHFSSLFDLQLDFEKIIAFFWIDFWELVFIVLGLYFLFVFKIVYFYNEANIYYVFFRIMFFIFLLSVFFYLFSEVNYINDVILVVFFFFLYFIFDFLSYFIQYLKLYKDKDLL